MRRFGALAACAAVGAVGLTAHGGAGDRRLPLRSPRSAAPHLTAVVERRGRSRLVRVDPSTLRAVRTSAWRVGATWGWVGSPGGRRVALAQCRRRCNSFVLRIANTATLRWASGSVALAAGAGFYAGLWPRPGELYALVGGDTALALDTVDTVTRRIVTSRPIAGPLLQLARTAGGLVLLAGAENAIVPARLIAIGSDGSVRSVTLERIVAGTHYDRMSPDLTGTVNLPGLAVDPNSGIVYVIDPSGLVAAVDLGDLRVTYHQIGSASPLTRFADWLTPAAEAKGTNGDTLTAQWLGKGLIAVAGKREAVNAQGDSYRPTGLRIVDTRNWSARMLDPRADAFMVADGLLLDTGTREGLAAYGPTGSLRWRSKGIGKQIYLAQAYRSLALVAGRGADHLVDLTSGRVVHEASLLGQLLLGPGSPSTSG